MEEPLSPAERRAQLEALDDEFKAWSIYGQVIADFGDVRPFSRIREAEGRHIDALRRLFDRYGLACPVNPWPGKIPQFESIRQACLAAVQAEIDNAALYERLLASTSREDILQVFRRLRDASQLRHLNAFRRCASRMEADEASVFTAGADAPMGRRRLRRRGR